MYRIRYIYIIICIAILIQGSTIIHSKWSHKQHKARQSSIIDVHTENYQIHGINEITIIHDTRHLTKYREL